MAMNQSCFAFTGKNISQPCVYFIIKSAVRSLQAKANGATFSAINTRDLKIEEVLLPNEENLNDFSIWADSLFNQMLINSKESLRLAALRDALLPNLMSGEIDVWEVDVTQPNSRLYEY